MMAVALLAAGLSGVSEAQSPGAEAPRIKSTRTPIKHVVIIYQENHAFDDVLGSVCPRRRVPCDGYTGPVRFRDGSRASNIVEPDIVPKVDHLPRSQILALANKWNEINGCQNKPHSCVSHYRPRDIPNLSALAKRFLVSDRSFSSDKTASFGAHITLAAGTMNGFYGNNPHPAPATPPGRGWGCPSHKLTLWAPPGGKDHRVPSCIPDKRGRGPFRESPVPYAPTIMERLEQRGFGWHIYQGLINDEPRRHIWAVCEYFHWCEHNRFDLEHDSSVKTFLRAARSGELPALSMLIPLQGYSQHNRASMKIGDNYIGKIVGAVQRGPQWRHTAVFITYDDCGCFYDHVKPPEPLGIREPMVVISPWVKYGGTDSHTAVVPYSMLAFVQYNFKLSHLSANVDKAYNYRKSFDFRHRPRLRRVPMVMSHIPASEIRQLALHPPNPNDPT